MYKAIGEDAWRDGVFSHAAPWQDYQASLTQFEDGSLGGGIKGGRRYRRGPAGEDTRGAYRIKPMSGAYQDGSLGLGAGMKGERRYRRSPTGQDTRGAYRVKPMSGAYQDGSLGHTALPAFSPREMRGLGYAFRDGVLGDDSTPSISITAGSQPRPTWKPDLASMGVGVMAGALLFYFMKW